MMNGSALALFLFGAILLWGGLTVCIRIAIRNGRKS
jgi:hypothetical protein